MVAFFVILTLNAFGPSSVQIAQSIDTHFLSLHLYISVAFY